MPDTFFEIFFHVIRARLTEIRRRRPHSRSRDEITALNRSESELNVLWKRILFYDDERDDVGRPGGYP
jgi:hypothetical protein